MSQVKRMYYGTSIEEYNTLIDRENRKYSITPLSIRKTKYTINKKQFEDKIRRLIDILNIYFED